MAIQTLGVVGAGQMGGGIAQADVVLSPGKLRDLGIHLRAFGLVNPTYSGDTLLGYEHIGDLSMRRKGIVFALRLLHFAGGKLKGVTSIPLPITTFEQAGISDDGKRAIVIGEAGAKMLVVDVPRKAVRVLLQHKRGQPGFRAEPLLYFRDGAFYVLGYFHDEHNVSQGDYLARINLEASGKDAFEKVLDVSALETRLGGIDGSLFVPPDRGFFLTRKKETLYFYHYNKGILGEFDQGISCENLTAKGSRIAYVVRRTPREKEVLLRDMASGKTWTIGERNAPYTYLFLSSDGQTLITTVLDLRGKRMSFFVGKEADNFALKPVPSMQNREIGTLRFSHSGKVYTFLSPKGLQVGTIK
ncbi:MAG: hypothetical protein HYU64_16785 [Armatimonadetes bacterium]|nr:hypothetical protein [Armatimonadota bacterium]